MIDFDIETWKLLTEVTDEEAEEGIKDEYGVIYSKDGIRVYDQVYGVFPDGLFTKGVREYKVREGAAVICDAAFSAWLHINTIELPESIVAIGNDAFAFCEDMANIKLPDSLIYMGTGVFWACWGLISVELPKNLRIIYGNPFCGPYKREEGIIITNQSPHFKMENDLLIQNTKVIAFSGMPTSVVIPNYITSIGQEAFRYCEKLKTIELPEGLTTIDSEAFEDCDSLTTVHLPSTLVSIGESAFDDCTHLREVNIPNSVTSIGDYAFYCCTALKKVVIPDSITEIGCNVFKDCENLKKIYISCSPNADENAILEKFKGMLEEGLHDKIEIIRKGN